MDDDTLSLRMELERADRRRQETEVLELLRSRMDAREGRLRGIESAVNAMRAEEAKQAGMTPALTALYGEPDSRTPTPAVRPHPAPMSPGTASTSSRVYALGTDDGATTLGSPNSPYSAVHPAIVETLRDALYDQSVSSPDEALEAARRRRAGPSGGTAAVEDFAAEVARSPTRRRRDVAPSPAAVHGAEDAQTVSAKLAEEDRPTVAAVLDDPATVAAAIAGGLLVGGCAGWLVGYAVFGAAVKGLAAKSVLAGTTAQPVAISTAAATATSAAGSAAAAKSAATITAAAQGSTVQQAVPQALAAAESAAAQAAAGSMQAAGPVALSTPYVTPAVVGATGAGAGSIALGAAAGGVAAGGSVAAAVGHLDRKPAVEG